MHNLEFFKEKSKTLRRELFEKYVTVQQGHPGSVMSMLDIVVALYYGEFIRPDPSKKDHFLDKLIVSKGHATVAIYPILSDLGVIPSREWENWGNSSSILRVFGNTSIPGVDATTGSLGHGLGVAAGLALSFKKRGFDRRVFTILGEGELYEGSTWESVLFASHQQLDNLFVVIDRNDLIILGETESCLKLDPIDKKMEAFGYHVLECDGHDFGALLNSLDLMVLSRKPTCLIANTVKGKGIKLMENKPNWHYWNPVTDAEIAICRDDLA